MLLPFLYGIKYFSVTFYFLLTLRNTIPSFIDYEVAELTPPSFYTYIMGRSFQDFLNENETSELNFPVPIV
jgi:hypothetical protein